MDHNTVLRKTHSFSEVILGWSINFYIKHNLSDCKGLSDCKHFQVPDIMYLPG